MKRYLAVLLLLLPLIPACCHVSHADRFAQNRTAMVQVIREGEAFCSGFQIAPQVVLTAAHCADPARPLQIVSAGFQTTGQVRVRDEWLDLAIIDLAQQLPDLSSLELCRTDSRPDQALTALGYPGWFRLNLTAEHSRVRRYSDQTPDQPRYLVSTDIAYAGMSGGPVLENDRNCVAGLTSQMAMTGTNKTVSLAVPAKEIREFLTK